MASITPQECAKLKQGLDEYFGIFASTLELVDKLIVSRSYAPEILILLCSRLDALACNAAPEDAPRKQAFIDFVTSYARRRDLFESVSAGDLYYELVYHQEILPGMMEKPGRIRRFSRVDDNVIRLLDESGIPLTEKDAALLLKRIAQALKASFRVSARQPLNKPLVGKAAKIKEVIMQALDTPKLIGVKEMTQEAISLLLNSKRIATILYENFRSESIHGVKIILNEKKFFTEDDPYWEPTYNEYFGISSLSVEFPAKFLVSVLRDCIGTYRQHLISKGRVPPDIFLHTFVNEVIELIPLLDEEMLLSGSRLLHLKLPER